MGFVDARSNLDTANSEAVLASENLNAGFGMVRPEKIMTLEMPKSLRMVSGAPLFFQSMFEAVHRINRRGDATDFVAIGLPDFNRRVHGLAALGESIALVGSAEAVLKVLDDDRILPGVRRAIEREADVGLEDYERPEFPEGVAFVRSRKGERATPAALAREMRRLEARIAKARTEEDRLARERILQKVASRADGSADEKRKPSGFVGGFVQVNSVRLNFDSLPGVEVAGTDGVAPRVSTWGLSHKAAPLLFSMKDAETIEDRNLRDGRPRVARTRRPRWNENLW